MAKRANPYGQGGRIYQREYKRKGKTTQSAWWTVEWWEGGKVHRKRVSKKKKEAEAFLRAKRAYAERDRVDGVSSMANHVRLDTLRDAFLDYLRQEKAPRTVRFYSDALSKILPGIACTYVDNITPAKVRAYRGMCKEADVDLADRTVNSHVSSLKRLLNWGMEEEMIRSNPIAPVKPLRETKRKKRRALPEDEIQLLLEVSPERYAKIWRVLFGCGLRFTELATLRWEDLDLDRRELTVREDIAKRNKRRVIPLAPSLVTLLREHHREAILDAAQAAETLSELSPGAKAAQCYAIHTRGSVLAWEAENKPVFVFVTQAGRPWNESMLLRKLKSCAKAAGKDEEGKPRIDLEGLDLHGLRKTFASQLIRRGVNPKVVQKLLGHATIKMTMEVYAEAYREDEEAAVASLDSLLSDEDAKVLQMPKRKGAAS